MATTNHLGITLIEQSQSQKEVTMNQALVRLDALLNNGAKSRATSTPPGSPASGDLYIIGGSPTGAWSGQAGKLGYYDQIWRFITPAEGVTLWVNDEDRHYVYTGSSWQQETIAPLNTQTGTSYTLAASDNGVVVLLGNAASITLTLPSSLPVGFHCAVVQTAAGQVTFTAGSGATRRNRQSHTKTAGQYAVCNLHVITNAGGSAAEYVLSGDTAV